MTYALKKTDTGQLSLFFNGEFRVPLKDNIYTMEHPFFSLSKKKDLKIRHYEHNGEHIEIAPSVYGMPTMFDEDVLVYCISYIKAKMKQYEKVKIEEAPSRLVTLVARQFLVATNRGFGGREYRLLENSLKRLNGVSVSTTIKTNGLTSKKGFGLIESYNIVEKSEVDGRMIAVEVVLSEWIYNAILSNELLTLSPNYYDISSPLKKKVYKLARKHCGNQSKAEMNLSTLHKKSGSTSPLKKTRYNIKKIEEVNDLPDYKLIYLEEKDKVVFVPRQESIKKLNPRHYNGIKPKLKPETHENVRKMLIKRDGRCNFDVHALEQEWLYHWEKNEREPLKNPEGAFYRFCEQKK